jgi:secondary thiamine-phosphate synthase enzyme
MIREIEVVTTSGNQMVDITNNLQQEVTKSGVKDGICYLYVPHTTAGITVNEHADPSVREDILTKLTELVPPGEGYRHVEGNADAHIKASIIGSSAAVIIEGGRIRLGSWQGVFFCEFDGPRRRRLFLKLIHD